MQNIIKDNYKVVIIALILVTLNVLIQIAQILPYYGHLFRLALMLLSPVISIASLLISVLFIVYHIYKKAWFKLIVFITISIGIIIGYLCGGYIQNARRQTTHKIIKDKYCSKSYEDTPSTILGGIKKSSYYESETKKEGKQILFINESHCLIAVCAEEIYSCESDEVIILD